MESERTAYLNDLLLGRAIFLGLPIPGSDERRVLVQRDALYRLWADAHEDDRDMIARVAGGQDQLLKAFDEGRA